MDPERSNQLIAHFEHDGLSPAVVAEFHDIIRDHYRQRGRSFAWRETRDPYRILVSEVMLQQTQTSRVVDKYEQFLGLFPDFETLAAAPLRAVLESWQGLGYNRRAVALHRIAQEVAQRYDGRLPSSPDALRALPGVGPYTAAAVAALAFDQPTIFVETNIRQVFLHFFFAGSEGVPDRDILPLVEATLDRKRVREWYWALYDYGAALKKSGNITTRSAHYRKQSPFAGSNRELRSEILKLLLAHSSLIEAEIVSLLKRDPAHVRRNLAQLQSEGFIAITERGVSLV
jgi:A/G-specific adenine glycosylase